jgi:3-mercaptopyruvate sulfurtransferase SseA
MAPAVLISTADLRRVSDTAIILDAAWVYPPLNHAGIDVRRRYAEAHIPGSWFLDLAALSEPARRCDPRIGASTVATALEIAGYGRVRVYPGSLVEYAVRQGLVPLP